MTTTQTGGGNGAAPDGGSGRKLPTRPGWWWYHDPSSPHGVCVYVGKSPISGQMILDTTGGIVAADEVDGEWLAPIPGPAVLAALAEYGDAVLAADGAPDESSLTAFLARSAADRVLRDAIRAERGGDA